MKIDLNPNVAYVNLAQLQTNTGQIDISRGIIKKERQNPEFSTFEPSLDNIKYVYKPDLLMIPYLSENGVDIGGETEYYESDYIPHH